MSNSEGLIPKEIGYEEIIVRGIVHPLFYSNSKGKLKEESYLPPPNKNDVSTLRYNYTDSNYCKQHIKQNVKISGSEYCGLAVLQAKNIEEINASEELILENGERLTVCILATPMDNLKMHSDILYSHSIVEREPNTYMRKLAKLLKTKSKYLPDSNSKEINWNGGKIDTTLF